MSNADLEKEQGEIKAPKYSFGDEVDTFVKHIESLNSSLPLVMMIIIGATSTASRSLIEFRDSRSKTEDSNEDFKIEVDDIPIVNKLIRDAENLKIASNVTPRSSLFH